MERFKVTIKGVSPLLMHSCRDANPLEPMAKEIKKLTSKRNKTDEDLLKIMELEYRINAYYDENLGFYINGEMVEAAIINGAKANKNGKKTKIAITVEEEKIQLIHKGSNDIDELYQNEEFKDVRFVVVNRSKIMRCRPRFNQWGLEFHVSLNNEVMDSDDLIKAIDVAGKEHGIGDYRPRYGRFEALTEQIN